jgi:serine/threonine-protein phosphatase 5
MNSIYGFKGEVQHKYDDKVMSQFTKVFNLLPLAAVIQDKVRTERPMLIAVA